MNPTTGRHPAARMAGRAGGAGMLGAAAAAAVVAGDQHGHRRHGDLPVLSPKTTEQQGVDQ